MDKMSMIYEALLELHAEMVWDEALKRYQITRLYNEIDQALQQRDEEAFIQLSSQLQKLSSMEQHKENLA